MLEKINSLLARSRIGLHPPIICLLTGSSGCGKTFLAKSIANVLDAKHAGVYYFDSIDVPSVEEMNRIYGSGEKWQETMTHQWIQRLAQMRDKALVVFEGQYHPKFAIEGCRLAGIKEYGLAVVTCDEHVWAERLRGPRGQPHLVTDDMRNWARVLRDTTVKAGGIVIDTTASNVEANLLDFEKLIESHILRRLESV